MSRTFILKVEDQEYDVDDLTVDEMIAVQELCDGVAFSDLHYGDAKVWRALAFTMRKRDQPDVTMDDIGAIKGLELIAGEEEMPPLPPSERDSSPNGSAAPDGSGVPHSPASTRGSRLSTLAG